MRAGVGGRRRNVELLLGLLAATITIFGYILVQLAEKPHLPADLWLLLTAVLGLFVAAHVAVRTFAPRADPTLLPLAMLLTGIGFVMISRLDRDLARIQAAWTAVGVVVFIATLGVVRRIRTLERYRYTFLFLGVVALLVPLAPGIGKEINGARLWVSIGSLNFQPGEAAKVLLVIFFAAYLVDKRELLASGSRRIGRLALPAAKHLGPLVLAWGVSILIMVRQKDLGSSLLFFAVFAAMLYIATERAAYLLAGLTLFVGGAAIAYQLFGHVQDRISIWIDPWSVAQGKGFQIVQSQFALGSGGFAGRGLGLGNPTIIPNVSTDFVFSAIGEELGLLGAVALLIAVLLFVGSGLRIAVQAERPFSKLFAAGLTTIVGVQTFVIVGGVTRVIPLTGITLPFVSYGGSSLVANFVILALLLRISADTAAAPRVVRPAGTVPVSTHAADAGALGVASATEGAAREPGIPERRR
jgi:cell division protein FtsW (lipid II flippase)